MARSPDRKAKENWLAVVVEFQNLGFAQGFAGGVDPHGFYCYLDLRGKMPGGPEEQIEQAQFDGDSGYKAALLSTLRRTRQLVAEGQL